MKKRRTAVRLAALCLGISLLASDMTITFAATWSCKNDSNSNPIVTQRFNADPGVMVYNDEVYVYSTNDVLEYKNGQIGENTYGKITTLNCFSSKDLVNWTDHGTIQVAGSNGAARWARNSWAPCATHKVINGQEKFFLYFADGASGIGVLTADSPTGPWRDPLGRAMINKQTANCWNVEWMFDPAVMVDSDGTGYLCFGGGVPGQQFAHPKTARIARLGQDMTSVSGTPAGIDAPYILEDSGINKIGNKYYYSYCSNWNTSNGFNNAAIEYMVSDRPMGPYKYAGEIMKNPGVFFPGSTGNNHHSIFEFRGKQYMAYHTRAVESATIRKSLGYRSTQIDPISVGQGKIDPLTPTMKGPGQLSYVNPYETVQAETIFNQGGINVAGSGDTYVTDIQTGDFTSVKGVNFSKGVTNITAKVRSGGTGAIEIRVGSATGNMIGKINVSNTNGQFREFSGTVNSVSGVQNVYFVYNGSFEFDSWKAANKDAAQPSDPGQTGPRPEKPGPNDPQPTQPQKTAVKDGWYYLKNVNAQKYLQVAGNIGKANQNVELGKGTGVKGQKWYVKNIGNGYITLRSGLGDFMLDVASAKNADGTNIGIYHAHSGTAQQFKLKATSNPNVFVVLTKASKETKALDDYNFSKADGTNVCQWTAYGAANQQWVFEHAN